MLAWIPTGCQANGTAELTGNHTQTSRRSATWAAVNKVSVRASFRPDWESPPLAPPTFTAGFANCVTARTLQFAPNLDQRTSADRADSAACFTPIMLHGSIDGRGQRILVHLRSLARIPSAWFSGSGDFRRTEFEAVNRRQDRPTGSPSYPAVNRRQERPTGSPSYPKSMS